MIYSTGHYSARDTWGFVVSDNMITPGGNRLCDGCDVRDAQEHQCSSALCICGDCCYGQRSCPKHPYWSGMTYDCGFCILEEKDDE